jgi:membrane-bound metal-dependent hydrolase YbcI (DUF457 family)
MDILSHAVAGACVGAAFGQPVLGAACGVLPDLALATPKRVTLPTAAYNATHSALFVAGVGLLGAVALGSVVPLLAVLSHILLDLPTHGKLWAPPLLYPFRSTRYSMGREWEWFNRSWWQGLGLTLLWSLAWLLVTLR